MSEPVQVYTNVRPQNQGPNSRVRMGENVLAIIRTPRTMPINNQEVDRAN